MENSKNQGIGDNFESKEDNKRFGQNQKKAGDAFRDKIVEHLKFHYPNSSVETEVTIYGSPKKSKVTGKMIPKMNKADIVWDDVVISAKYQGTRGTTEQKLVYELCAIVDYMQKNSHKYKKAYVVYHGDGIKILTEELPYLPIFVEMSNTHFKNIETISWDDFQKRYNNENISA